MTTYVIDHADPLKSGFLINPGSFNGPGGTYSDSPLRLYGRGALEWGEGVNENELRILEHFSGATPPVDPLEGQIWHKVNLYVHRVGPPSTWYVWNFSTVTWDALTVTEGLFSARPALASIADYYYCTDTQVLYRWDTLYKQENEGWNKRHFSELSGTGVPTLVEPEEVTLIWYNSRWKVTNVSISDSFPSEPYEGQLIYKDGSLYYWNGTTWVQLSESSGTNILDNLPWVTPGTNAAIGIDQADSRYVNVAGDTMEGDLSLDSVYKITNCPNPVANGDVANKIYVDDSVSAAVGGSYIPLSQKGAPNGVATLDAGGIVTSTELPQASTSLVGVIEIATDVEVQNLTSTDKAVTPSGLNSLDSSTTDKGLVRLATSAETIGTTGLDTIAVTPDGLISRTATTTRTGIVELATDAETLAGVDTQRAVTPASMKYAIDTDFGGIGTGAQRWYDMSASRLPDVDYQNTTGKPIMVRYLVYYTDLISSNPYNFYVCRHLTSHTGTGSWVEIPVTKWNVAGTSAVLANMPTEMVDIIVPNNHYYRASTIGSTPINAVVHINWFELR